MFAPFVVHRSEKVHPQIDLQLLLDTYTADPDMRIGTIGSPRDLWVWEEFRARHEIRGEDSMPTDVLVWGVGEPEHPANTRIGGKPFLPSSMAWPEFDGEPGTFVAQFDFRDSRDIVGETPGDVLLIFAANDGFVYDQRVQTVWVDADEGEDVESSAYSPAQWQFPELFGALCRTFDDPDLDGRAYNLPGAEENDSWMLPVCAAAKIGGIPWLTQESPAESVPSGGIRFLCQLVSMHPAPDQPWPWINVAAPMKARACGAPESEFEIGGSASICFYLDDADALRIATSYT